MPGYKDGGLASIPYTEAGLTSGARAPGRIEGGEGFDVGIAVGIVFADEVVDVAGASDVG